MINFAYGVAALSFAIWVFLVLARYNFWLGKQRLGRPQQDLVGTPSVLAIIPARNEVETISRVVSSIIKQNYPGMLSVVLVDDQSDDGTIVEAKKASLFDLRIVHTSPLPPGWSGKTWALETAWQDVKLRGEMPDYIWLNDADILHMPEVLTALVTKSQARQSALTSLMVRLNTDGLWGKLLIPAFIYFFQLIYPFNAVNSKASRIAGAAGGCMLIEPRWLERIGGFASIKDALIDDCALAARIQKSGGRLWLGHATASTSLRSNRKLSTIWQMVRRTAYAQLSYNPITLFGCMLGLGVTFFMPLVGLVAGVALRDLLLGGLSGAALLLMAISYIPTLKLYDRTVWEACLLPIVTGFYGLMTLHSAWAHLLGKGNSWKGRDYGRGHDRG